MSLYGQFDRFRGTFMISYIGEGFVFSSFRCSFLGVQKSSGGFLFLSLANIKVLPSLLHAARGILLRIFIVFFIFSPKKVVSFLESTFSKNETQSVNRFFSFFV